MPDGRTSHRRKLRGTEVLHTRFGVTDPKVFKTLSTSAVGVEGVDSPSARYTSLAYVQQASARTAVRHRQMLKELPQPGESASLDFTRGFTRDLEGHVCAAVILDLATYSMWVLPLFSKSGLEAARAVREYRAYVRDRYRTELRHLRADSDPSFAANGHGECALAADLLLALRREQPHVSVTFSPAYASSEPCGRCCRSLVSPAQLLPSAGLPLHAGVVRHFACSYPRAELLAAPAVLDHCPPDRVSARAGDG